MAPAPVLLFPYGRDQDPLDSGTVLRDGTGRPVPPGYEHCDHTATILVEMRTYVKARKLGNVVSELGFILKRNADLVRAPDVAFISQEKLQAQGRTRKFWEGAPDLAVEVLSPDDRPGEVLRQVGEYLDAGTRLVGVVRAMSRRVSVYRSPDDVRTYGPEDTLCGEEVIPGFSLPVSKIFE